jgi:cytochrome c oxidase assembly protein subunit 11
VSAANRRTLWLSLAAVAVMFTFGFVMAPLYDTICRVLGVGGKTDRIDTAAAAATTADLSRTVTIEFSGQSMAGLPWEFRPLTKKIEVHPGATTTVKYLVRNTSGETIVGQAVPSVVPGTIGAHFKKIECFCFTQQTLAAGETREMPVQFVVDPELPPQVRTITLSYAFFNTDKAQAKRFGGDGATVSSDGDAHHGAHASGG